ncbi:MULTISPECIES: S41 family peptidase [unclassified Coleofasciculus]|uniref:S41 family peptidase n=1 Tax=unclassified Coleofasciculus TaxID=2692782 RepID=UPI001D15BF81|nr:MULTISPECIES: PDZ domain-containing protein [unclassified Coleofasciculus]
MTQFRLLRDSRLVILTLISVSLVFLYGLISPALSRTEQPTSAIFEDVWETVNENFYDPNFNGVDWQAMRSKYEPEVKQAQSTEDMAVLINQMLSELNTSHTHFYTPNEPAYYQVLGIFAPRIPDLQKQLKDFLPNGKPEYSGIGIVTKDIDGKTFVSAIFDGSPAAKAGLMVGDRIMSVDSRPFHPIQSFAGKADQEVKVLVERSPEPDSQQTIIVTPKILDTTTMFLDAQRASTQVIEREGKKIGYVHMWSYGSDQYQQQLEDGCRCIC